MVALTTLEINNSLQPTGKNIALNFRAIGCPVNRQSGRGSHVLCIRVSPGAAIHSSDVELQVPGWEVKTHKEYKE